MKRFLGVLISLSFLIFVSPAEAGHEPVGISLGLVPKSAAAPLVTQIEKSLASSKYFLLRKAVTVPGGNNPWPDNQWKIWRGQTDARVALVGTVKKTGEGTEISCRAIDLKGGFESKQVSSSGSDLESIAREIVRFLHSRYPLRAVLSSLKDDLFLLDVGLQDGVKEGNTFVYWRYPESFKERLAEFQVTKANQLCSEAKLLKGATKLLQLRTSALLVTEDPSEILSR
ncbi:MAG TPA: hypothetical protein DD435_09980 [Cyanobacteria bacterium UBA8530]|nr:hypothetical protein [Cyanobacteria bacterium UBA8530]